jgi:phage tail-like protein
MADMIEKKILPHRNFKFHIFFEGKKDPVAVVSKMSVLKRTTEVWDCGEKKGEANSPRKIPGKTKFEPVTLEQGVTLDTAFQDWVNQINDSVSCLRQKDNDFRKEINIEVLDFDGNVVSRYKLYGCWVSEYTMIPDVDANANVGVKMEIEGWEKDK